MYSILCDGVVLYDPRQNKKTISSPKLSLASNTAGGASMIVRKGNPCYDDMKKLRSIFEIQEDGEPIFRGRLVSDKKDMMGSKTLKIEGALAYLNDSQVPPFNWSDLNIETGRVKNWIAWILKNHNNQVSDFQKIELGDITVTSSTFQRNATDYQSSWDAIKSIIDEMGGYLFIEYKKDGRNVLHYLADLREENTQAVQLSHNLLDLTDEETAQNCYTAILPIGSDGLTIEDITNVEIPEGLEKNGAVILDSKGVDQYGYICKRMEFKDTTDTADLAALAIQELQENGERFTNTIEVSAVDLHYTSKAIASLRVNRYTRVISMLHGYNTKYRLTAMDLDLLNPQNTRITFGDTIQSVAGMQSAALGKLEQLGNTLQADAKVSAEQIAELEKQNETLAAANASTSAQVTALQQQIAELQQQVADLQNGSTGGSGSDEPDYDSQLKEARDSLDSINLQITHIEQNGGTITSADKASMKAELNDIINDMQTIIDAADASSEQKEEAASRQTQAANDLKKLENFEVSE